MKFKKLSGIPNLFVIIIASLPNLVYGIYIKSHKVNRCLK